MQPIVQPRRHRATYTYDPTATAVYLTQGYFRMIARASGMTWDHGNDIEIEMMVKAIIDAARQPS